LIEEYGTCVIERRKINASITSIPDLDFPFLFHHGVFRVSSEKEVLSKCGRVARLNQNMSGSCDSEMGLDAKSSGCGKLGSHGTGIE